MDLAESLEQLSLVVTAMALPNDAVRFVEAQFTYEEARRPLRHVTKLSGTKLFIARDKISIQ